MELSTLQVISITYVLCLNLSRILEDISVNGSSIFHKITIIF